MPAGNTAHDSDSAVFCAKKQEQRLAGLANSHKQVECSVTKGLDLARLVSQAKLESAVELIDHHS